MIHYAIDSLVNKSNYMLIVHINEDYIFTSKSSIMIIMDLLIKKIYFLLNFNELFILNLFALILFTIIYSPVAECRSKQVSGFISAFFDAA